MLHPMDGTMDDVRLFVAVARSRSFAAASRETGVPTSTVSRRIARLETQLGLRLLQRTSRRVATTDEGARLLGQAAPLFDGLAAALDALRDRPQAPTGHLRVTAPLVTGAGPIARALASFARAHPGITVDLSLTNAVVDLVRDGFDLAFRAGPVRDGDLVARRLWPVEYALAASRGFVGARSAGAECSRARRSRRRSAWAPPCGGASARATAPWSS
jgi:LysR family transcriptional regulator AphB